MTENVRSEKYRLLIIIRMLRVQTIDFAKQK